MDRHAIIVANPSGTIELWSTGAERLFGYSAAEAVGQKLDLVVPEDFRDQHWAGFHHAMSTGESKIAGQGFDIPIRRRSGELSQVRGILTLVRNAENSVIGAMAIFANNA